MKAQNRPECCVSDGERVALESMSKVLNLSFEKIYVLNYGYNEQAFSLVIHYQSFV